LLTAAVTLNLSNQTEGFTITGSAGVDSITGGAGNDTINGAQNTDTLLDGAAGTDTLNVASFASFTSSSDAQIANIENVVLGTSATVNLSNQTEGFNITGPVTFTGFTTNITGGAGNDTINSGADAATINGGAGADSITAGAGNDTIDGGAGADSINGGAGADTMTGGLNVDTFTISQGDSPVVTFADLGAVGLDTGDTFTFAGLAADRITDFGSSEEINMSALLVGTATPTNGLATDQGFFVVQGNLSGGTFTVDSTAGGLSTLVVYDGDSTGGVTQTALVLSGVTLSELTNAYIGSSLITHIV